jgi:Tfp pilus assembly protein PilN
MRPLNLAGRPFRNERLPATLFAVAAVVLAGLTAWHVVHVRRLLPSQTEAKHRRIAALEDEMQRLRGEAARLQAVRADPGATARWALVKELVDRRAFSWTELFGVLEEVLPDGVRLVSITPSVRRGKIELRVVAVVKEADLGWQLVKILEESGHFAEVFPTSEEEKGQFSYVMLYEPPATASPAASPVPPAPPAAEEEAQ